MKFVHTVCLLVLITSMAWGNTKVDSLKQLLEHHTTADKTEVLWGIAYELFDVDNVQALFYAERAYHEVWKGGDSLQMVKVGTTYGQLLRRMGRIGPSIEVSSKMLPIAMRQEYQKYRKMLLNSLSVAYIYREDYAKALEYLYVLKEFAEESDDQEGMILALNNICWLLYKLEDFDQSIQTGLESLALAAHVGHEESMADNLLNVGAAYLGRKNYDSALYYTHASFDARRKAGNGLLAPRYQQLALSHFGLQNYDSAVYCAHQAIEYAQREGYTWSLGVCNNLLASVALLRKRSAEAKTYLERTQRIVNEVDFPWIRLELLMHMARYQAAVGNLDSTMRLVDAHTDLHHSIYNGKMAAAIRSVQARHEERKNRKQLAIQSGLLSLQEGYLSQQRLLIVGVTTFLLIVSLLSFALYRAYRMMKSINNQLDQRVVDRTKELLRHRDALQRLIDEENGRRGRVTAELLSMFGSLKGLLHLAEVDPGKRDGDYLEKALELTMQMESVSQKFNEQTQRKAHIPTR